MLLFEIFVLSLVKFGHNLSFWVLLLFEFLSFFTNLVFELSQSEFLSFDMIWGFEFDTIWVLEFCQDLIFLVLLLFKFFSFAAHWVLTQFEFCHILSLLVWSQIEFANVFKWLADRYLWAGVGQERDLLGGIKYCCNFGWIVK